MNVEELRENGMTMMKNEERDEKMVMDGSENSETSKNVVKVGGGYRRDRPPDDDCCPICFDDFNIPCRTSCGHWFCGNCIVQLWRYMGNFKQCTCPICGSLIFNLVPHPSALIQTGEEVSRILNEIKQFNNQNMVGWFGIFKEALDVPPPSRRRLALMNTTMHLLFGWSTHEIPLKGLMKKQPRSGHSILLRVYVDYEFEFFPFGVPGLVAFILMCGFAPLIIMVWKRWRRIARDRHLAQYNVIE